MTSVKALVILIFSALVLSACADSKLKGTVDGDEFGKVLSAIFLTNSSAVEELQLVLTNYEEACVTYNSYFKLHAAPSEAPPLNALIVRFFLMDPVATESYDILADGDTYSDGLQWVHGRFQTYSEEEGWSTVEGVEGSIDIDSIDSSLMTGTISLTLETGDVLEGKFAADYCDEPI